jgi:hypothetical protein
MMAMTMMIEKHDGGRSGYAARTIETIPISDSSPSSSDVTQST